MRALIVVVLAAVAATGGNAMAAEAKSATGSESRMVCFSERQTGSNLRKKICMTEAERERRRKEDQEALANLKNGSSARGVANVEADIRR